MINVFSEGGKSDMYGFKEETGDTEDYFPFACAEVKIV